MVVETDGYLALIEHLSFNLDVFTGGKGDTGTESVEDIVTEDNRLATGEDLDGRKVVILRV